MNPGQRIIRVLTPDIFEIHHVLKLTGAVTAADDLVEETWQRLHPLGFALLVKVHGALMWVFLLKKKKEPRYTQRNRLEKQP